METTNATSGFWATNETNTEAAVHAKGLPPGRPTSRGFGRSTARTYPVAGPSSAQDAVLEPGLAWVDRHIGGAFEALSGKGHQVVTVSDRVRDEVRRFYRLDGKVIPNGVDVDRFRRLDKTRCREELGLPKSQLVGLYVGRLEPLKGIRLLAQAAAEYRGPHRFMVVGQGSKKAILEEARKKGSASIR